MANRIGVCSWSLQPESPTQLVERVSGLGLRRVQLALDPLRRAEWSTEETRVLFDKHGLELASGMMQTVGEDYSSLESIRRTGGLVPDEHWEANRNAATENAKLARGLGISLVSFHAGFLPEERGSTERTQLIDRLREVVDRFEAEDVATAFETGQESAANLAEVMEELDRPSAGVNFDPANMILYDKGDPVEALDRLLPWVRQIHVKDARRTLEPGTWGSEVPVGEGEVDWKAFFERVRAANQDCDLIIEREAGTERERDIRAAIEVVRTHCEGVEL